MYSFYKSKSVYIFLISAISFFALNLIEDLIHFNIGRNPDLKYNKVYFPITSEWYYIISVMVFFSILQGLLTYYFDIYSHK